MLKNICKYLRSVPETPIEEIHDALDFLRKKLQRSDFKKVLTKPKPESESSKYRKKAKITKAARALKRAEKAKIRKEKQRIAEEFRESRPERLRANRIKRNLLRTEQRRLERLQNTNSID